MTQDIKALLPILKISHILNILLILTVILFGSATHVIGGWTEMASGTSHGLYGVWGTSGSGVFAVGGASVISELPVIILHYDGNSWSQMTSGIWEGRITDVWGSSGSDVFAVGSSGLILHYDGNSWGQMTFGTSYRL